MSPTIHFFKCWICCQPRRFGWKVFRVTKVAESGCPQWCRFLSSSSWLSWWRTCRRCQEVQACWKNKRPSRRQKRRVLWAPSLTFRNCDKRVHVLRCSAQLCAAAAAFWRRGQKESRARVSPADSLYGRSWVSVDAERWRAGAELGGGAAGGHFPFVRDGGEKPFPAFLYKQVTLQVRRTPRHQGTPRPNRSKPHVIRPVEDITEEDIELVADNMTDKVYNSAIVSSEPVAPVLFTET